MDITSCVGVARIAGSACSVSSPDGCYPIAESCCGQFMLFRQPASPSRLKAAFEERNIRVDSCLMRKGMGGEI